MEYKIPDPSMFDNYEVGGERTPPPQAKQMVNGRLRAIRYVAVAPDADHIKFGADSKGYLKAVLQGVVLPESGYQLRQVHITSQPYPKRDSAGLVVGLRNASPMGDYLLAHGIKARPSSVEEYEQLILATAGREFQLTLDWEAYDPDLQTTVASSWAEFPDDPEHPGQKLPYFDSQEGRRYYARAVVRRFIAMP